MTAQPMARANGEQGTGGTLLPGPRGIGTAVAFDWAIGCELLLFAPLIALGLGPGADIGAQFAPAPELWARTGIALLTVLGALPLFALGEGLRRGMQLARVGQLALNSVLFLAGIGLLRSGVDTLARQRRVGGLVPPLYMLLLGGLILWQLTRPQTREWFARVSTTEARARHGTPRWLATILVIALIGGASVVFDSLY